MVASPDPRNVGSGLELSRFRVQVHFKFQDGRQAVSREASFEYRSWGSAVAVADAVAARTGKDIGVFVFPGRVAPFTAARLWCAPAGMSEHLAYVARGAVAS